MHGESLGISLTIIEKGITLIKYRNNKYRHYMFSA